jgi:iron complex outermembrane receptor protein
MPRITLQYTVMPHALLAYATLSRGYSPPTISEIFPGTALLYNNLQPESGWNTEVGLKRFLWANRIRLSLSLYDFRLEQTIVPRYDSAGHAYYINAGGTDQKGLEAAFNWIVVDRPGSWLPQVRWFASYALQDYHFRDYLEGANNYSGNPLTGVPRNIVVSGWDIYTQPGFYLNATYTYTAKVPLNDAGTPFAQSYQLVQAKLGWAGRWRHRPHATGTGTGDAGMGAGRGISVDLFVGVDNALNQVYSLGDDLNAAGGRYYNPAAARNFFGGCSVRF